MQRRILRRLPSKDDTDIKKASNTPDVFEAQSNKSAQKKTATDDLHFNLGFNRADRFKVQFVQVYLGRLEFSGAEKINAVVAIYLQASDRLYEVILVDKDSLTEIVRFYVLEDELDAQMRRRHEALMKIYYRRRAVTVTAPVLPPLSSPTSTRESNEIRLPTIDSPRVSTPGQKGRRRSRGGSIPSCSPPTASPLTRSTIGVIPSFKKKEVVQDPVRFFKLVAAKNISISESGKKNVKMTMQDIESKRQERMELEAAAYEERDGQYNFEDDGARVGDDASTVLENDISGELNKDIGYYSAVILNSLYCSRKKEDTDFRLLDDASNNFFKMYSSIPAELKSTVGTFVDCKSLVQTAMNKWELYESTDAHEAKTLLNAADLLSTRLTAIVCRAVDTTFPTEYKDSNTVNPNKKKYRLLWQAAYAAIVATIRQNKSVRSEWKKLLDIAKTAAEREEIMRVHAKQGKFRKLANGGVYIHPGTISPDEIKTYRDTLRAQKQNSGKKSSKSPKSGRIRYVATGY